jgi:molybdopterin synthase sulfur carrier subunit
MQKVNFHAMLRDIVGGRTVELPIQPGQTVRDMLAVIIERYPALQPKFYEEDGSLTRFILIFIDGRNILLMGGLDAVIPEDAIINIFPPVAGG